MADFPAALHTPSVTAANKATVAGTQTNDPTFDHTQDHVDYGEEIVAAQTKVGTGSSNQTPVANAALMGDGAGSSQWDTTPTVVGLTATGALSGASASITGTTTTASLAASTSVVMNSDFSYVPNGDGNLELRIGGAAGTLQAIYVPTTGDIQAALDDMAGTGPVYIMPGTHTPASEIDISDANATLVGFGPNVSIISASSFSVANQSILKGGDGVASVNIKDIGLTLDTNSDIAIETVTTTSGSSNWRIDNALINSVASGRTAIKTDGTNNSFSWYISNLRIGGGSAGTGLNIDGLQRSHMEATIDVGSGTHWNLDASSNQNICNFIVDLAGTDGGTGNSVTEVVF